MWNKRIKKKNLSEEDKDMIVNEISLVIQNKVPKNKNKCRRCPFDWNWNLIICLLFWTAIFFHNVFGVLWILIIYYLSLAFWELCRWVLRSCDGFLWSFNSNSHGVPGSCHLCLAELVFFAFLILLTGEEEINLERENNWTTDIHRSQGQNYNRKRAVKG